MHVAVVGSRGIIVDNLQDYLPQNTTEIISGGARGVDRCAREYAKTKGITLVEFLPDYPRYGRSSPIRRNQLIIDYADIVLAFWDGSSKGTKHVIENCRRQGVQVQVYVIV